MACFFKEHLLKHFGLLRYYAQNNAEMRSIGTPARLSHLTPDCPRQIISPEEFTDRTLSLAEFLP
jgi:hypothetical protein